MQFPSVTTQVDRLNDTAWIFYKYIIIDEFVKSPNLVTPAQAGVYKCLIRLDSRLRGNDKKGRNSTFYEAVIIRIIEQINLEFIHIIILV